MPKYDWVFWLNVTNIALGAVVILAVLLVVSALVWEIVSRRRKSGNVASLDEGLEDLLPGGRLVPGVGVTMADGGERLSPLPEKPAEKKHN